MTDEEALAYWYGRIDFEKKPALPGEMKLDRMRALLAMLGNPHHRLRIVHVAGTKGKGSSSAMLASVLQRAGYRVGLFTSPHLRDVSERIQIDRTPISVSEMTALLTEIQLAVQQIDKRGKLDAPTFFEIGTALGFLYFVRRRVDLAIIEVGLGGRLDSTNVCTPLVALITNISRDHMAILGHAISEIGREKAGIIKPGRPTVCTATHPDAVAVVEATCRERRSTLTRLNRDFSYHYADGIVSIRTRNHEWPNLRIGLLGEHQAGNAAGVVAVVEELRALGLNIGERSVREGLEAVDWPARLELVSRAPLIILDCAHNVASVQALVETLASSFTIKGRKAAILAVSTDKQLPEMMQILGPHFDHFYLTRYANNPRCAPPERLAELLRPHIGEKWVSLHENAVDAWNAAVRETPTDGAIIITGSVFLAGELQPFVRP